VLRLLLLLARRSGLGEMRMMVTGEGGERFCVGRWRCRKVCSGMGFVGSIVALAGRIVPPTLICGCCLWIMWFPPALGSGWVLMVVALVLLWRVPTRTVVGCGFRKSGRDFGSPGV
jgi:ABC-type uncharacterized transport system permease subunit